jgi:hypothetical protein
MYTERWNVLITYRKRLLSEQVFLCVKDMYTERWSVLFTHSIVFYQNKYFYINRICTRHASVNRICTRNAEACRVLTTWIPVTDSRQICIHIRGCVYIPQLIYAHRFVCGCISLLIHTCKCVRTTCPYITSEVYIYST